MAGFVSETTIVDEGQNVISGQTIARALTGATASKTLAVKTSLSRVFSLAFPGHRHTSAGLGRLVVRGLSTNSSVPVLRWENVEGVLRTSAAYGSFIMILSDPAAFGISKMEGRVMSPQMMLVLEASSLTLCVSMSHQKLTNMPIGFFLGAGGSLSSDGAGKVVAGRSKALTVYSGTSGALSVASGRVSFTLGLTGPCLTLDTACSSSLVALHVAVSAMRLIECSTAAATGVGMLTQVVSVAFSVAGMLSACGRCHTFDRRADGYCRGEGCGAFLLATADVSEALDVLATVVQ